MDKEYFGSTAGTIIQLFFTLCLLGKPKFRIFNKHLMLQLIFEYRPGQSLPPFEQSVY